MIWDMCTRICGAFWCPWWHVVVVIATPGADSSPQKDGAMIALKFQRYISVIWRMNPCMCVLSVPHWHVKWCKISSGISVTPSDNRKRNLCWCDVTWVPRPFKSSSTRLFVHLLFKLTSNKTLELHVTGPLYPEARGFPNGKRWGNPFRCTTSSWSSWKHWYS